MHLDWRVPLLVLLYLSAPCLGRAVFMDPVFSSTLTPYLAKGTTAWRGNAFLCEGQCRTGELEVGRAQSDTGCTSFPARVRFVTAS
ncbi:hypothetical protein CALCODRAFT_504305 [Calocera cornea HHB12733]|uniref:Uncharacterized protein n=1 Tax=Calocera cornea HHB12733 TaxID=1353952 RepID=A0A165CHG5_9BASI|nr:hypothetical protein CALCODRAFT_504305 [Calocera cornea HHB12733]